MAKLNARLNPKFSGKSLACWFLIAATCPQVLAIAPTDAQNQAQTQVSANQTDVVAVASRITDINTNVAGDRLNLTLNFDSSDRPQVTYSKQGKVWVALLNGAQLQLGDGNVSYTKTNPLPGISAIEATQYAANKVQIRVTANDPAMLKDLIKRQDTGNSLVFSLEMQPSATRSNTISSANLPNSGVLSSQKTSDQALVAQNTTNSSVNQPLFEPKVTITSPNGKTRTAQTTSQNTVPPPVSNPVMPQLPGRVPGLVPPFRQIKTPPVGDIATSTSKLRPDIVDLGSAERVPSFRFISSAIDVLSVLGRIVGLNVVSLNTGDTGAPAAASSAPTAPAAASSAPTDEDVCLKPRLDRKVDINIQNEPVQDIFNNILRITCLDANRIGNTIFVATKLPVTLKNLTTKSYRLNQITVGEASAYLIGLGASRVVNRQRAIPGATTATVGTAATATVVTTPTETVPTLETVTITPESGATALLKGLQVIAEERGNSVTLIGSPRQIEFAEAQLARLDTRKRQVVINVKIVEVNFNSGVADANQTVAGNIGFTGGNPGITTAGNTLGLTLNSALPLSLPTSILAAITSSINSGTGKVLTDPSLTVQEGESASISLTEKVVTENTITVTAPTGGSVISPRTQTIKSEDVGLSLNISLARVDDNGFVNLSISPAVT
ncbi:MAG: secretin N-terminal domain-containing protein, partial [Pseudanabaena sp. ELA748]